MILRSDPRGPTPREELVSLAARHGRRAERRASNQGSAELSSSDRQRVDRLASQLRIADVERLLDRCLRLVCEEDN